MSLSPDAAARAAAAGALPGPEVVAAAAAAAARGPFWLDCAFLNGRFDLASGRSVLFDSVVLVNCRCVCVLDRLHERGWRESVYTLCAR